jgi:hypothetical protein
MDVAVALTTYLVGRRLVETKRREYDWAFRFEGTPAFSHLCVSCPWRVLIEGRIAFAGGDDGHKFGLPTPLNGEEITQRLLGQRVIDHLSIRPDAGDLSIIFSGQATLEVLNMSSGYEGWQIGVPGMKVIGVGGGEFATHPIALGLQTRQNKRAGTSAGPRHKRCAFDYCACAVSSGVMRRTATRRLARSAVGVCTFRNCLP